MGFEIPLVLFIIVISISFSLVKTKTKTHTHRLPPGPPKLPIIGNLHQIGKLPHRSLRSLSEKFGDLMYLQLGSVPAIVVSSPDRARDIFKNHDLIFSGRTRLYAVESITYGYSSVSTAPYGETWRELRKIMTLELMTNKQVQSFEYVRAHEVAAMIDRIRIASSDSAPIDLSALAFSMSNNFVSSVAFGPIDKDNDRRLLKEIFNELQRLSAEFNIADYFTWLGWINKFNGTDKQLQKQYQDIDRFLNWVIEQHSDPRRPKRDHEDIVDVLLRIQKDSSQTIALTDEQIKGVLIEALIGGTDTSAATIEWTMTELMRNPTARKKAQQEVRKISEGKGRIEEDDLPKLTYLKQVVKESFRLHPPAPLLLPRETTEKCIIENKYEIPAKTRVFFNASAISRDPKYWENPEEFLPERFANSEVDYKGHHYELLPFGSGRRKCPGINFAMSVVYLALANLLFYFDWEIPEGMSVMDIDMEEAVGVTMHRKTPLVLVAKSVN